MSIDQITENGFTLKKEEADYISNKLSRMQTTQIT